MRLHRARLTNALNVLWQPGNGRRVAAQLYSSMTASLNNLPRIRRGIASCRSSWDTPSLVRGPDMGFCCKTLAVCLAGILVLVAAGRQSAALAQLSVKKPGAPTSSAPTSGAPTTGAATTGAPAKEEK